jgi:hypothetical protein
VVALPVVRVQVAVQVVVSPVVPVVVSPVVPAVVAVALVGLVAVVAPRAPSAVVVDVRFEDASPSAPSVKSLSRCRPRLSAVSRSPVATVRLSSGCVAVPR